MNAADSKVSKTYVRSDNTALLTCSHCGHQKIIGVDRFKGHNKELKIKCVCQNIFRVNLEFRKFDRKKTLLKGTYINHSQKGCSGKFMILDISLKGMTLNCLDIKNFKAGDEIGVKFTLEDVHQTEIKKEVIVRNVRNNLIGCEFKESEEAFGSHLGYYVMYNL